MWEWRGLIDSPESLAFVRPGSARLVHHGTNHPFASSISFAQSCHLTSLFASHSTGFPEAVTTMDLPQDYLPLEGPSGHNGDLSLAVLPIDAQATQNGGRVVGLRKKNTDSAF